MSVTIPSSANAFIDSRREFIESRKKLMESDPNQANDAHYQAEIDHVNAEIKLVQSWHAPGPAPAQSYDAADIRDDDTSVTNQGPNYVPPSSGTGNAGSNGKPPAATDGRKPPSGSPSSGDVGYIETYKDKLPPDMPPVFDLQVGDTGKTLRQTIEETAAETGTPAIILAGQAWQETKAGLDGKDAATIAKYGKTGSGGGGGGVMSEYVTTATVNPGNGQGDSGILQINPNTLRGLIEGGNLGGTLTVPAHPELAGRDRNNIKDATVIAGTMMKSQFDYFRQQSYSTSDADAWLYSLRAYVGGGGAIVPGNPSANASGGGDVTYVDKVRDHMEDFANGVTPRWPA